MKWLAALVTALALAGPAHGAPPLEFRGFPIGGSMEDFKSRFAGPNTCHDTICIDNGRFDYGPVSAKSYLAAFPDGRLASILIIFDSAGYQKVLDSMTLKYGKPTKISAGTVQNRFGARFPRRAAEWQRPDGAIVMVERTSDVDTASVMIADRDTLRAQEERAKGAAKRGAEKL